MHAAGFIQRFHSFEQLKTRTLRKRHSAPTAAGRPRRNDAMDGRRLSPAQVQVLQTATAYRGVAASSSMKKMPGPHHRGSRRQDHRQDHRGSRRDSGSRISRRHSKKIWQRESLSASSLDAPDDDGSGDDGDGVVPQQLPSRSASASSLGDRDPVHGHDVFSIADSAHPAATPPTTGSVPAAEASETRTLLGAQSAGATTEGLVEGRAGEGSAGAGAKTTANPRAESHTGVRQEGDAGPPVMSHLPRPGPFIGGEQDGVAESAAAVGELALSPTTPSSRRGSKLRVRQLRHEYLCTISTAFLQHFSSISQLYATPHAPWHVERPFCST